METLRRFRDEVLFEKEEGIQLVKEYYRIAPGLVKKLKQCRIRSVQKF
ncbi:MAG: CFI-box-CTERM domain-containing protein [Waltera sp.]